MPKQQWPEHISKRERQKITTDVLLRHAVKPHQHERVREKDCVIEKCLRRHEHETKKRTSSMFMHNRVPDFAPGRMSASANARRKRSTVAAGADCGRT